MYQPEGNEVPADNVEVGRGPGENMDVVETRRPKKPRWRICLQCSIPHYYGKLALIRHKIDVHGRFNWYQKEIGLIPLYVCNVCSKGFTWKSSLEGHVKTHGLRKIAVDKQLESLKKRQPIE